jgi:hypothetical protein
MIVLVESGAGARRVDLLSYLETDAEERAHADSYAWIKALRHLRVDGGTFRSRFTCRGDSLWWFAELFLHKQQAILQVHRLLAAFDRLVERERPLEVTYVSGPYPGVVAHAAAARTVRYAGPGWPRSATGLLRMDARAMALTAAARLSRARRSRAPRVPARVAAFVHRAFWRSGGEGSDESYVGPVLGAIEARLPPGQLRCVGVGPRSNFRARRWWDPLLQSRADKGVVAIERYAPAAALAASRELFRDRHAIRMALWNSADLRAHAIIRGCDCWPLVREQLAGIALLQFPWSARAMDEAASALDALEPDAAVTYAEAGGWGRALALECRRRGIPLAGLQHGFIYRHWLNYLHEPDETCPDPGNPIDRGFPFPARTLVFDEQAARHLSGAGRFPPETLEITGSARLDELRAAVRGFGREAIARVRAEAGAANGRPLVVLAAKEREARGALPALIAAVREMPGIQLAIKPHPAETADVYDRVAAGAPNVRVLPVSAPLPPLLAAAHAVVTVNSTVAIDALALGIPSLVVGLPNNLTPFVESGAMRGAGSAEEIAPALAAVLYDQEFRSRIESGRALATHASGEGSAARAAEAILRLADARAAERDAGAAATKARGK